MRKELQAALFDWDGCLYNSLPTWLTACRTWLQKCLVEIDDKEIARHIVPDLKAAQQFGVSDWPYFLDGVITDVQRIIHLQTFNAGALELIAALQDQTIPYVVVTSSYRDTIGRALDHHQVASTFPSMITRNDVTKHKPDPEPIFAALALLNLEPHQAIMIGDSPVDIIAGNAAGVQTALYFPAEHQLYYELETLRELNPTYVIHNLLEIKNLFTPRSN